jgi:serine/threonine-protein kinase RsbT
VATAGADFLALLTDEDVVRARQLTRRWALTLGFSLVEQTKIVTAASELGRNTVIHGGGGSFTLESVNDGTRRGLRLTFEDQGPGIADVQAAMRDGFSTGHGLGLGLGGARRLMNEFSISSQPGKGTRVVAVRWK